jgi:hypothetical protein
MKRRPPLETSFPATVGCCTTPAIMQTTQNYYVRAAA